MSEKILNQTEKSSVNEGFLHTKRPNLSGNEFEKGRERGKIGSNRWHNLIATNATIAIGSRSHNHKCEIYVNDMSVQLDRTKICFPDVIIVKGDPNFADSNAEILLNPTIILEIFSNKVNSFYKMEKMENYLAMNSIRECLLVKEDEMRVEHYARQNAKQWIYRIYNERDDVISLDSINCKISLSEIYSQIKFKNEEMSSKAVN